MVWDDLGLAMHPRLASASQALRPQPWTLMLSLRHFQSTHYMKCSELSSNENCSCVFKNYYTLQSGIQRLLPSAEGQACFPQHLEEEGDRNQSNGKREKKGEGSESPGVTSPVSFPNTGTEATDTGDRLGSDGRKDDCCRVFFSRAVSQSYPLTFFPKASKLFGLPGMAYPSLSLPPLVGHHCVSKPVQTTTFFPRPSGPF